MRSSHRGRLAAPAALLGAVGVFGLCVRSGRRGPRPACRRRCRRRPPPPCRSPPSTAARPPPSAPRPGPAVAARAATAASAKPDGIIYQVPPALLHRPRPGTVRRQLRQLPRHRWPTGTDRAPNLQGLGAGTVDFWVSTGRMPLANPSEQAIRKPPKFDRLQTLEIAAYVQSLTPGQGLAIPVVNLNDADLENGNSLFTLNCAACHTITGAGDALAGGAVRPQPPPGHHHPDRRGHPLRAGQHAPLQPGQHHRCRGPGHRRLRPRGDPAPATTRAGSAWAASARWVRASSACSSGSAC